MIVLQEKGLWEGIPNKLLEFSKKEHKGEEVLKMNPRGQVSIKRLMCLIVRKLVHRIRISEILPWDRKSYLTHVILPRASSNVIMRNCIFAYSGTSGSLF